MSTTTGPRAPQHPGHVEVVCGPMFAGKSEELLRRVRRARFAGFAVEVMSHAVDDRRGAGTVSSHSGLAVPAAAVGDVAALEAHVRGRRAAGGLDVVAIDEAQFFGPDLVDAVQGLAGDGLVVLVAGLDVTFEGRPFEPLPSLCALAERVTRLTAVCGVCGADAAFHERVVATPSAAGRVEDARAELVGGAESYVARCRHHLVAAPWR
ncbi:thymidine kinase [Sanguibacter massiliensis]|uniref:thymidine kinase n=1 Tax=Sanguibacter massiliensis TaxID=1973217 RepID=UPI001F5D6E2E|nr:thymidine kinase [Sanguibacter massiliensis]